MFSFLIIQFSTYLHFVYYFPKFVLETVKTNKKIVSLFPIEIFENRKQSEKRWHFCN